MSTCKPTAVICILALFLGCASSGQEMNVPALPKPASGPVYRPTTGMPLPTVAGAVSSLRELFDQPGKPGIKPLNISSGLKFSERSELEDITRAPGRHHVFYYDENDQLLYIESSTVGVFDDRIEISPHIRFLFKHLPGYPIVVEATSEKPSEVWLVSKILAWVPYKWFSGKPRRSFKISFSGRAAFVFEKQEDAERFANDLFAIQQALQHERDMRLSDLRSKAKALRDSGATPAPTEDQRRLIVQANALTQAKNYRGAVDLYLKAVALDPARYTAAYFNLALLSAQQKQFDEAIDYMRTYLFLEPAAKDARSAQDKIYEWELQLVSPAPPEPAE